MSIAENLERVRARVAEAEAKAGRAPGSVTLVAVSKFQPVEAMREAYAAGQRVFGENYAQELRDKAKELADLPELKLHFIGRLQKNKAKYVAGSAGAFEALDDLEVAAELDRRAAAAGRVLPVLIEVNFGEEQKGGVRPEQLDGFIDGLRGFAALRLEGLMSVPPAVEPEEVRPYFKRLAALARERGLPTISMGMSADFEVAIAEGATHVRVGTAIFGERPKKA